MHSTYETTVYFQPQSKTLGGQPQSKTLGGQTFAPIFVDIAPYLFNNVEFKVQGSL
jgi:hypothetical protein